MVSAVLQRWAVRIAFLTIAVGATTVLGWLLNIPILTSLLPSFTPMKFNTGIGFILAGAALALQQRAIDQYPAGANPLQTPGTAI